MRDTGGNKKPARFRRVGLSSDERNSVHASTTHRGAVVVDLVETAKILLMAKVNPRPWRRQCTRSGRQGCFPGATFSV